MAVPLDLSSSSDDSLYVEGEDCNTSVTNSFASLLSPSLKHHSHNIGTAILKHITMKQQFIFLKANYIYKTNTYTGILTG